MPSWFDAFAAVDATRSRHLASRASWLLPSEGQETLAASLHEFFEMRLNMRLAGASMRSAGEQAAGGAKRGAKRQRGGSGGAGAGGAGADAGPPYLSPPFSVGKAALKWAIKQKYKGVDYATGQVTGCCLCGAEGHYGDECDDKRWKNGVRVNKRPRTA